MLYYNMLYYVKAEKVSWLSDPTPNVPHLAPLVRIALALDGEAYDARAPPPLLYKDREFTKGGLVKGG